MCGFEYVLGSDGTGEEKLYKYYIGILCIEQQQQNYEIYKKKY